MTVIEGKLGIILRIFRMKVNYPSRLFLSCIRSLPNCWEETCLWESAKDTKLKEQDKLIWMEANTSKKQVIIIMVVVNMERRMKRKGIRRARLWLRRRLKWNSRVIFLKIWRFLWNFWLLFCVWVFWFLVVLFLECFRIGMRKELKIL